MRVSTTTRSKFAAYAVNHIRLQPKLRNQLQAVSRNGWGFDRKLGDFASSLRRNKNGENKRFTLPTERYVVVVPEPENGYKPVVKRRDSKVTPELIEANTALSFILSDERLLEGFGDALNRDPGEVKEKLESLKGYSTSHINRQKENLRARLDQQLEDIPDTDRLDTILRNEDYSLPYFRLVALRDIASNLEACNHIAKEFNQSPFYVHELIRQLVDQHPDCGLLTKFSFGFLDKTQVKSNKQGVFLTFNVGKYLEGITENDPHLKDILIAALQTDKESFRNGLENLKSFDVVNIGQNTQYY